MTVDIADKYKRLSEQEHVLLRPARYLGDINTSTKRDWTIDREWKVQRGDIQHNPAFLKLFDEIISNSVDFSLTAEGKALNVIRVTVDPAQGFIAVYDNGGIPVVQKVDQGETLWIPDLIFGHLRSGSNFADAEDSLSTGQNGEGSSLVNIFSKRFDVETCDGKNTFHISYLDNMKTKTVPQVAPVQGRTGYTTITYFPDLKLMGMAAIEPWAVDMLRRRCVEVAACNPQLRVFFNGENVRVSKFADFVGLFDKENLCTSVPGWNIGLTLSQDGFKHNSYVNTTHTFVGGTHVSHVMDKIVSEVREHIQNRTKQTIKPAEIEAQFHLFIDAKINNPRYSSQTKENLITPVSKYANRFTPPPEFIQALLSSPMMRRLMEWATRRKEQQEFDEAAKEVSDARKASFHHIEKYRPATNKVRADNLLFVAEGDSALKPLQAAKRSHHGLFPLRGKPDNVYDKSIKALTKQKEFQDLIQIMGLDLSKFDPETLRYGGLVLATDADHDGAHIRGLITVSFWRFWPRLIENGFLRFLITPVVVVKVGKTEMEFFSVEEYDNWAAANPNTKHVRKYYKGLGSWETKDMERFMNDEKYMRVVSPLDAEDARLLQLAFDPEMAAERKDWLALHV